MPPTSTWGTSFVTQPFATRTGGDVFRYLAASDDTHVTVNGSPTATLNRGQLFEQTLTAASVVVSDNPILVTQYMTDGVFPGTPVIAGDPLETIVPAVDQFLSSYSVATPASGFTNYLNVVAPTASLASVTLDGVVVPAASFTAIPGSSLSGAQLAVTAGAHTLGGSQPLGVIVYGLANGDAYGYPGASGLGSIAVAHLTLVKTVEGGTAEPTDWTLSASGPTPISGTTGSDDVTGAAVDPGTYTLTESGPSGYTASDWSCDDGTLTGNSLVLADGDDATCTITNTFAVAGTISALGDAHGWLTLKNGDDHGARFDLQVELLKNGTPVAWGIQRCINGVARNPTMAKEAIVPWGAFSPIPVAAGDVLSIRFSARMGTNPDATSTKCTSSHNSAVGLRFYYDAATRNSRFAATIGPDPSVNLYLHSTGTACNNTESMNVTARTLDTTVPWAAQPGKCKDTGSLKFVGGNPWMLISTWSLAPLP